MLPHSANALSALTAAPGAASVGAGVLSSTASASGGEGSGGGAAASSRAAPTQRDLDRAVWLSPCLRLESSGGGTGLRLIGRGVTETVPAAAPAAAAAAAAASSTGAAPAAPTQKRTRFRLRAPREGRQTLTFYLVRAESELARRSSSAPAGRFAATPPPQADVLATATVPLSVHARRPSPTLSVLLDACDPRPEESAAVATLRLLAVNVAAMTGMVDGRRHGHGHGPAAAGAASSA